MGEPEQHNETWWIVLNPSAMRELLGVCVKPDGTPVGVLMSPTEETLVKLLAEEAWAKDPTVDLSVAHGWAQAPEGLQAAYEAKRAELRAAVHTKVDEAVQGMNEGLQS